MNTFRFDLTNKNKAAFSKGFKTGLIDDIVDIREQKDEWEEMYTVQKGRMDRQKVHLYVEGSAFAQAVKDMLATKYPGIKAKGEDSTYVIDHEELVAKDTIKTITVSGKGRGATDYNSGEEGNHNHLPLPQGEVTKQYENNKKRAASASETERNSDGVRGCLSGSEQEREPKRRKVEHGAE